MGRNHIDWNGVERGCCEGYHAEDLNEQPVRVRQIYARYICGRDHSRYAYNGLPKRRSLAPVGALAVML